MEINLNTSYVQIEIDTWNKSTLEIEAYVEGEKLSKEQLQEALKSWNLNVEGSGSNVSITSDGSHGSWDLAEMTNSAFQSLEALKALEVLGDIDFGSLPEMPEMPELPELPEIARLEVPEAPEMPELPELPNGVTNVSFDSEAYKSLEKTIRSVFPESVVIPGLVGGGTDARYFYEVSDDVYRFYPIRLAPDSMTRFHGIDEKIDKENYKEIIEFTYQLIKQLN